MGSSFGLENGDRHLVVNGDWQCNTGDECGTGLSGLAPVLRATGADPTDEFTGFLGVVPPFRRDVDRSLGDRLGGTHSLVPDGTTRWLPWAASFALFLIVFQGI